MCVMYKDIYIRAVGTSGTALLRHNWRNIIRGKEIWRDLERPVQCSYIGGKISRCLFIAVILVEIYYKGWRDLERAVWSFINWRRDIIRGKEIWTGLIGALILAERYGESCSELL